MTPAELKAYRKSKGWTQAQAALMVEAASTEWQEWESGRRKVPRRVLAILELREIMESCTCGASDKFNQGEHNA